MSSDIVYHLSFISSHSFTLYNSPLMMKTGMSVPSNLEKVALSDIQSKLLHLRNISIQLAEAQHQQIQALSALSEQVSALMKVQESSLGFLSTPPGLSRPPSFEYLPPPPPPPPFRVSLNTSTTTLCLDASGGGAHSTSFEPLPFPMREWASAAPFSSVKKSDESRLLAMAAAKASAAEEQQQAAEEQQQAFSQVVIAVLKNCKGGKASIKARKISEKIVSYERETSATSSVIPPRDDPSYTGPSFMQLLQLVPGLQMMEPGPNRKRVFCFTPIQ